MSQPTAADRELISLKRKLESALSAQSELENDLKIQSTTLIQLIGKLSLAAKGIDLVLDNKLALLRKKLNDFNDWSEIEDIVIEVSQLLQKHSIKNDKNINHLHEQFHQAAKTLQKASGLPNNLKKQLRQLITDSNEHKDSVVQYVPALNQLIECYQLAIDAKDAAPIGGLLNQQTNAATQKSSIDKAIIERFSLFISNLVVSTKYKPTLNKIRAELNQEISQKDLLEDFLEVFDIINKDLIQERSTAKVFLSTLSETLSTVQQAVQNTIHTNEEAKVKHGKLTKKLQQKIVDMARGLDQANSLADIKLDINEKLSQIAGALEEKTTFEVNQLSDMSEKLHDMQEKVRHLEKQSKAFEKQVQEQQARSYQDALTKLGNRAAFDDYFAKKMVRFHHTPFDLALVVIDLDNFKRINDTYGHTAGDKTLQVIANTLAKEFSQNEFVGRYGGEEFVIIFSNYDQERLVKKLNTIRLKVAKLPFKFKNNKVSITLSIGATHVKQDDNVHIAFERADTALYQAKKNGKNQVIYTS